MKRATAKQEPQIVRLAIEARLIYALGKLGERDGMALDEMLDFAVRHFLWLNLARNHDLVLEIDRRIKESLNDAGKTYLFEGEYH